MTTGCGSFLTIAASSLTIPIAANGIMGRMGIGHSPPHRQTGAMDLGTARLADFVRWVGTEVRVADEAGDAIALELVEAKSLPTRPGAPRPEPFSLIFRGPRDRPLDQRIFALEHQGIGRLALFLVPIGPGSDGRGPYYQAIFN